MARYIQQLVLEDNTPTDSIEAALVRQQRLGYLRHAGLRVFRWLFASTALNSARREVIALIPPALSNTVEDAERGVPTMVTMSGCGAPLQDAIRYV